MSPLPDECSIIEIYAAMRLANCGLACGVITNFLGAAKIVDCAVLGYCKGIYETCPLGSFTQINWKSHVTNVGAFVIAPEQTLDTSGLINQCNDAYINQISGNCYTVQAIGCQGPTYSYSDSICPSSDPPICQGDPSVWVSYTTHMDYTVGFIISFNARNTTTCRVTVNDQDPSWFGGC